VVRTLREAEAAGTTSDVDVDQQQLFESVDGDSLPNVSLPEIPLPDVTFHDAQPDSLVGEEWTAPPVQAVAMVVTFLLISGSCLVRFLCSDGFNSGIEYDTCREVFWSLSINFIYGFFLGLSWFIVLLDIAHAAFLQLRACKQPPCDGLQAQ